MSRLWILLSLLLVHARFVIGRGSQPELKLVNIVFRHGDRTPEVTETYSNDPYANYTYYPIGRGGLTNEGKLREYRLGEVLKSRYGKFLGSVYEPSLLEARSSNIDRTKMSLQLVLSALLPPEPVQRWHDELLWQPIPAVYKPAAEDILFFPEYCSQYITELSSVRQSSEVLEKVNKFSNLITSLEELTGDTISDTNALYALYHTFDAQRSANLTLPEWAYEFYPDGELLDATNLEYEIMSYSETLKRVNGGVFLRQIMDNIISYENGTLTEGRKLFLYSGHEIDVGALQITLGVYKPHVPAYSSAVIVELWQQNTQYFVKVLQYSGIPSEVITQQIPGCSELCPLEKFLMLLEPVIATDADLLCP